MSKVLLIKPPWYRILGQQSRHCPLGLGYIAAVLEKHGHEVRIHDADWEVEGVSHTSFKDMTKEYGGYQRILHDIDNPLWGEIETVIRQQSPDIVGLSVMTPVCASALNVSRLVRRINPEISIVWGGVHPTLLPEETVQLDEVDIVVRGEGEYTFLDIVENRNELDNISGITYLKNGEIMHNPDRPLIQNLDELPFPANHLMLIKGDYPEAFGSIITGRGCPYQCIFCASHKMWTRKVRYRSVPNVISEIKEIRKRYRVSHFTFEDDTFILNKKYTEDVCNMIMAEGLNITWQCQTRADIITDELLRTMKKAGCSSVDIGIESGDEATLRKIKKGVTLEQIRQAKKILKKNKMIFNALFMIGFPWETRTEIERTIALMKEIKPDYAGYSITTPYPGTELYDLCRADGVLPENIDWSAFFHQSPDMFLARNIPKEEALQIIDETEIIFENYNKRQRRKRLLTSPWYVLKRIVRDRYSPWELWSLLRHLVK
ncbi:B12-binding domain-containing radical SAM protein [Chloroflexota bacterium]